MSEINRAVKGTNDILPGDSYKYRFVEEKMESFLEGECQIDLLAQIAYAIGEKPKKGSIYEDYFEFLKKTFGLFNGFFGLTS